MEAAADKLFNWQHSISEKIDLLFAQLHPYSMKTQIQSEYCDVKSSNVCNIEWICTAQEENLDSSIWELGIQWIDVVGNQRVDFKAKKLRRRHRKVKEKDSLFCFCNKLKQLKLCVQCFYRYFIHGKRKKLSSLPRKDSLHIFFNEMLCTLFRTRQNTKWKHKRNFDEKLRSLL